MQSIAGKLNERHITVNGIKDHIKVNPYFTKSLAELVKWERD